MLSSPHIRVGERFGTHVRMNLATSGDLVRDAVSRITRNLTQIKDRLRGTHGSEGCERPGQNSTS